MISQYFQQAEKHTKTNHNIKKLTLTYPIICEPNQIYPIITNLPKQIKYIKTKQAHNTITQPHQITKYLNLPLYIPTCTLLSLGCNIWIVVQFRTYALKQYYFGTIIPCRFNTEIMSELSLLELVKNLLLVLRK